MKYGAEVFELVESNAFGFVIYHSAGGVRNEAVFAEVVVVVIDFSVVEYLCDVERYHGVLFIMNV